MLKIAFKNKNCMNNEVSPEIGQFNPKSPRASFSSIDKGRQNFYFSSSFLKTDNNLDSPKNFKYFNITSIFTPLSNDSLFCVILFNSTWNASGQIPDEGIIHRWGTLNNTKGENTPRNNQNSRHQQILKNGTNIYDNIQLYYYLCNLYLNFTFPFKSSIRDDNINQNENLLSRRTNTGLRTSLTRHGMMFNLQPKPV